MVISRSVLENGRSALSGSARVLDTSSQPLTNYTIGEEGIGGHFIVVPFLHRRLEVPMDARRTKPRTNITPLRLGEMQLPCELSLPKNAKQQ